MHQDSNPKLQGMIDGFGNVFATLGNIEQRVIRAAFFGALPPNRPVSSAARALRAGLADRMRAQQAPAANAADKRTRRGPPAHGRKRST